MEEAIQMSIAAAAHDDERRERLARAAFERLASEKLERERQEKLQVGVSSNQISHFCLVASPIRTTLFPTNDTSQWRLRLPEQKLMAISPLIRGEIALSVDFGFGFGCHMFPTLRQLDCATWQRCS
jgi:hypothetical protein